MPRKLRRTRPSLISSPATSFAVSIEIAKAIPCAGWITAVLTPITRPSHATSGPPELPGLSAASVWITSSISRPDCERRLRPSAHHAGRHGALEAERVADRDRELPDHEPARVAELDRLYDRLREADHREVGRRVVAHELARDRLAVVGDRRELARAVHDVAVGEDEAVGREDEARARADRLAAPAAGVAHLQLQHRRAHARDHAGHRLRVGVEQRAVVRSGSHGAPWSPSRGGTEGACS
jgi:hypothetical protein